MRLMWQFVAVLALSGCARTSEGPPNGWDAADAGHARAVAAMESLLTVHVGAGATSAEDEPAFSGVAAAASAPAPSLLDVTAFARLYMNAERHAVADSLGGGWIWVAPDSTDAMARFDPRAADVWPSWNATLAIDDSLRWSLTMDPLAWALLTTATGSHTVAFEYGGQVCTFSISFYANGREAFVTRTVTR